jgi:serine/threonine protein kinase
MDTPILIDLSGYRVTELLYESSKTLIYRGVRTSDLEPVVIKLLRIEHPSFNELLQFRNQYAIAKNSKLLQQLCPGYGRYGWYFPPKVDEAMGKRGSGEYRR